MTIRRVVPMAASNSNATGPMAGVPGSSGHILELLQTLLSPFSSDDVDSDGQYARPLRLRSS